MTEYGGFKMPDSLDEYIEIFGAERVRDWIGRYQEKDCLDPRCSVHGDLATSYRAAVLDDIVLCKANHSPSIKWTVREASYSCTGPIEVTIKFSRDLLQNLEIGDEEVTITLTEPVL